MTNEWRTSSAGLSLPIYHYGSFAGKISSKFHSICHQTWWVPIVIWERNWIKWTSRVNMKTWSMHKMTVYLDLYVIYRVNTWICNNIDSCEWWKMSVISSKQYVRLFMLHTEHSTYNISNPCICVLYFHIFYKRACRLYLN